MSNDPSNASNCLIDWDKVSEKDSHNYYKETDSLLNTISFDIGLIECTNPEC